MATFPTHLGAIHLPSGVNPSDGINHISLFQLFIFFFHFHSISNSKHVLFFVLVFCLVECCYCVILIGCNELLFILIGANASSYDSNRFMCTLCRIQLVHLLLMGFNSVYWFLNCVLEWLVNLDSNFKSVY